MDIQLHYKEAGEGEALLLLHGNGESCDYFAHQMAYFSRKYRVIAVDTRGHGKSPRGEGPFTIGRFADDLLAFMDRHEIGRANILGFSDGGNIALTFALRHPERLSRLVLNGANLYARGVKPSVQIPITAGYYMASLFAGRSAKARRNAEMLALMVKEPNISPQELKRITVPTLVIAGTKDMIRESHTRLIFESLPDARLKLIPGDHFIANKNSDAFNEAVGEFLAESC